MDDDYTDQEDEFADVIKAVPKEDTEALRILKAFLNEVDVDSKTILNDDQINLFTVAEIFHEKYPEFGIDRLGTVFMKKQLSKDGRTQNGLFKMLEGRLDYTDSDKKRFPLFREKGGEI